ncbi:MAG: biopolymer transporter ExbD [Gammaproteobacteria bacterium]|nr:biopolymer transporter ExbD [Gammaproteobacteria bacterium]
MALGDGLPQPASSSADINIVPLVDVILVLLVIFIVTAPLISQAVKVQLPQAASIPSATAKPPVVIAITADGALHWDGAPLDLIRFEARARELAIHPDAELHIEADRAVPYDAVAQTMAAAARSGIERIGFVLAPQAGSPPANTTARDANHPPAMP